MEEKEQTIQLLKQLNDKIDKLTLVLLIKYEYPSYYKCLFHDVDVFQLSVKNLIDWRTKCKQFCDRLKQYQTQPRQDSRTTKGDYMNDKKSSNELWKDTFRLWKKTDRNFTIAICTGIGAIILALLSLLWQRLQTLL